VAIASASGKPTMSERDTFGPRLRSERERRNISLETIASVTKVSADLWDGLERNDFSRWPSGIFARAFVRDYARAVGLDEDEVLNEFCRLFPIGDRRVSRLIQAQAQLIGHSLEYSETGAVPEEGDRRAIPTAPERNALARAKFTPRHSPWVSRLLSAWWLCSTMGSARSSWVLLRESG